MVMEGYTKIQEIIDISAILHDIGINEAERKYNSKKA